MVENGTVNHRTPSGVRAHAVLDYCRVRVVEHVRDWVSQYNSVTILKVAPPVNKRGLAATALVSEKVAKRTV